MRIIFLASIATAMVACNNSGESTGTGGDTSVTVEKKVEKKASGCAGYYWFRDGATMEYSVQDGAGKETSRSVSTISHVRTENGALTADWTSNVSGREVKATYRCEGDKIYMDMKSFFSNNFGALAAQGGMELEMEEAYIVFPAVMNTGDQLEGTKFKITAKKDGKIIMTSTNEISERKVEGAESITTAAGTWNCMKITEKNSFTSEMMGKQIQGKDTKTAYWFAPGFGLVKHETYDSEGNLKLRTELLSIK